MRINTFYIAVLLSCGALFFLLKPKDTSELSFFGFAESNETKINYNYPVVVDKILVKPGQKVMKGEVLLHISRRKSKESLQEQPFKMAELRAESDLWKQDKLNDIAELELQRDQKIGELRLELSNLKKELEFKKSLASGLKTLEVKSGQYKPIEDEIDGLEMEVKHEMASYNLRIESIQKEMKAAKNPYSSQIKRLQAELEFDQSHQIEMIEVTAPNDGLVGNVSCKEEEHIPSYSTLLSFYEPHSGLIKGFVHENLTLQVKIGDEFSIASLKDETITYTGKVIGLGSRIVEIPNRLRKIQDLKSYGREVLIEIPKDNSFLQKEKVSASFIPSN